MAQLDSVEGNDPYRRALFLLVVFTISKFPAYFGPLRALRISFLLFLVCAAYAFLNPRKLASGSMLRTWPAKVVGALGVVSCLSVPFGLSMGHSAVFILENFIKTLVLTGLLITAVRGVADLRRLVWAVVVGGGVLAYLSIFIVGISKTTDQVTYDANDVGLIMVCTLPLAFLLVQTAQGWKQRVPAIASLLLIAATIPKTQSRGAFLALLLVGVGLLLLLPGVSVLKRVLYLGGAVAMLALAAPPAYWETMKTILEDPKSDYNYNDLNGRRMLAKRGIGYMLRYPVFGVGIDNFRIAEGTISDKAVNAAPGTGVRWAAAHNSFVQAGAETGVTGLVIWTALLVGGMVGMYRLGRRLRSWRRGSRDQRFIVAMTAYLPIALLGFASSGFFVSFAWMDP